MTFLRLAVLAAVFAWLAPARAAVESDPVVREALAAEARFDSTTALTRFLQADAAHPNDPFILQKIARQYSDLDFDTPDLAEKKRLCTTALAFAQRSVALAPTNAVNVLSLAICYGKLGSYSDTRTKIEYSRLVKDHAERALALDPAYDYAHHVLGRWHYEVASLGAATRFLVRLVYGGLPAASNEEAVKCFQKAIALNPKRLVHVVELGRTYAMMGRKAEAKRQLETGLAMPDREKDDPETKKRGRASLKTIS